MDFNETKKKLEEVTAELAAHEGLLNLAMDDLRKMYDDLIKSQSQLFQSDKLATVGLLAAGIAHEINNRISPLKGFLEILDREIGASLQILEAYKRLKAEIMLGADLEKIRTLAQEISELEKNLNADYYISNAKEFMHQCTVSTEAVAKIVKEIKTFSRPDKNVLTPASLNEILESVISLVWDQLRGNIELKKEYDPELPVLKCNSQGLSQVFLNLLVNAIHAVNGKGCIQVRTFQSEGNVCAEIEDTGCGIPPESQEKIFETFYTTKGDKGTGLGLSITKDIVRKHSGRISVQSVVGKGTVFTVSLPLV